MQRSPLVWNTRDMFRVLYGELCEDLCDLAEYETYHRGQKIAKLIIFELMLAIS